MTKYLGNCVMADIVRHVSPSIMNDARILALDDGSIRIIVDKWMYEFEGDGIVYVSNSDFPEINPICYDDHAYYAQGGRDFLTVCKERFMRDVKHNERAAKVAEILGAEAEFYSNLYADGKITAQYKNGKLAEISSTPHRMAIWKVVMASEKEEE